MTVDVAHTYTDPPQRLEAELSASQDLFPRVEALLAQLPEADAQRRQQIEAQIERESHAFFISARLYDDGVIDPRDTRSVLGMALSAAHSGPVEGRRGFGVFRM